MIASLGWKDGTLPLYQPSFWGGAHFSEVWMVGLSPDAADVDHQVWLRGKEIESIESTNRCYKIQADG